MILIISRRKRAASPEHSRFISFQSFYSLGRDLRSSRALYEDVTIELEETVTLYFKRHLLCPFYKICNIGLGCPQNVSVKFQLKILHVSFTITSIKCNLLGLSLNSCFGVSL